MLVKDHPENETILNKRVWNASRTQQGTVVAFSPDDREPVIDIEWDDGQRSIRCFIMSLNIEIV